MSTEARRLPYKIGEFSRSVYGVLAALAVIAAWGVFAYIRQLQEGLVVTGLRDLGSMRGSAWGLYIAFDVYFVGVSFAGISTAALIRLLRLDHLRPLARMAELLTVVCLILAAFSVIPDLGQPLRGIVNLFVYARPQSPFFGTFTLVIAGYLFASLVYLYLEGRRDAAILAKSRTSFQSFYRLWAAGYKDTEAERRRHDRTSLWLSIAILPLLVTAHSTLGFVFGIQSGRPGWFSALQAPGFVVMAGVSGIGMLTVIAALLRKVLDESEKLGEPIFRTLCGMLFALVAVYLYFMVSELLTMMYASPEAEAEVSRALLIGKYGRLYWSTVAALVLAAFVLGTSWLTEFFDIELPKFRAEASWVLGGASVVVLFGSIMLAGGHMVWLAVIPAILFVVSLLPLTTRSWVAAGVVAGILVNWAAIGKRLLIVVPSQTHGSLLPYGSGRYSPTWVEISIVVGLFALGALLYTLFVKVFPIMEVEEDISSHGGKTALEDSADWKEF